MKGIHKEFLVTKKESRAGALRPKINRMVWILTGIRNEYV
jgi:hypothetical protein